jgi:multidrug efflux pump subunit AcrA (membrane-fusion protein)
VPIALGALTAAAVAVAIVVVGSPSAGGSNLERTITVTRGVVQSTVSGSGNLSPAHEQDLNFATSGEVVSVYVKAGEHVHEGQLLARLDDSSAKVDLAQARADLQSAQDTLTRASSSSASRSSSATATAAQAPSNRNKNNSNDKSGGNDSGNNDSGDNSGGSDSSQQSTISPAAAQAAVDSAELAVRSAENALAATELRAPMPATVAAVNGAAGDTVASGSGSNGSSGSSSAFITLAQLSRFRMEVALSESDIGSVKVGQPATVTVNASGDELAGRVTAIGVLSSSSSSSSGSGNGGGGDGSSSSAVSYPVTITLDQTSSKLKAGMSATADIVTAQASGLTVPSQALQGSTVTLVRDGKHVTQPVQTGITGDTSTQILSGLKAGDQVVVRSASAVAGAGAGGNGNGNAAGNGRGRFFGGPGGLGGGFGGPGGFRALRGGGPGGP